MKERKKKGIDSIVCTRQLDSTAYKHHIAQQLHTGYPLFRSCLNLPRSGATWVLVQLLQPLRRPVELLTGLCYPWSQWLWLWLWL